MRTLLIVAICTLSVFTAIALACAVWIALRRPAPARRDPYLNPIGDVPGFSDEQLRALTRQSMTRIEQDAQRRSFAYGNTRLDNPRITRAMVDAAADRIPLPNQDSGRGLSPPTDADGEGNAFSPLAGTSAVRNFFAAHFARRHHA